MEMAQRLDINSLVHLNNFIFLVFSICTDKIVTEDFQCNDPEGIGFLHFILYGNLIVQMSIQYLRYGIIFVIQFLSACNLLDTCTRKFGAVCITINTFVFFGGVIIFDVLSMLYGIKQHFFSTKSKCREIEIFVVWISVMIIGATNRIIDYFKPRNDLIQPLNQNPAVL